MIFYNIFLNSYVGRCDFDYSAVRLIRFGLLKNIKWIILKKGLEGSIYIK